VTTQLRRQVRRVARIASPVQWLTRTVVVLAPLVVLLAAALAGAELRWWFVGVIVAGGLAAAVQADSHAAGVTLFLLMVFWWWSVPATSGVPVLVAAAAVIALHVAGTLAAYGPATLELDADLVRLWVRRGLLLWAVSVAAWAAGRLASPVEVSVVVALFVVAAVAWWAAIRFGPATAPGER